LTEKSLLFKREPNWVPAWRGKQGNIPSTARSWLYEPASLTQRLRNTCGHSFQVRLLRQCWAKPFQGEAKTLQIRNGRHALIREVSLQCDQEPLILARTIIPQRTLRGAHRRLSNLGTRPLGEVIFSYPRLQRLRLEIAHITNTDWNRESMANVAPDSGVWGRRTVYSLSGRKLLVCEFFLPAVLALE
jgi:chorismate lyase